MFNKARNEAFIQIMLNGGLRIEEVSELQYGSIEQGELVIREDGKEKRRVPIVSDLQVKLLEWLC
ncbi:tyrosine-type recombinase/integrase [Ammoniphilus sp. 3BR4]|uniref:tyrosine-type recombinase/integrase n=1 Tax=Ammoniphilus sp. 3BR4 TaxID=3158265 RepID=UPI003464FC78